MKTIAFFNNKGGVGKTSLVYHLAWMMSLLGRTVVVADLDPQENATSMFLTDDELDELWNGKAAKSIFQLISPLMRGIGDVIIEKPLVIKDKLSLIPGDLSLSNFEDQLSETWPKCLEGDERAFRVTTAFSRIIRGAANLAQADIALIDVGPNLGAINRAALVASDFVVVPLSADMFAIRGLQNVGPKLQEWRTQWRARLDSKPKNLDFQTPSGSMTPLGYVVSRYSTFARGPVKAYQQWLDRTPKVYSESILGERGKPPAAVDVDTNKLALLKDYRSLMPLAQEAHKPMFLLKPADGAIGGHQTGVQSCRDDFEKLALKILLLAHIDSED